MPKSSMSVFFFPFCSPLSSVAKKLNVCAKSSEFDVRDVLWRDVLTISSFKFVFSPEVEKNC